MHILPWAIEHDNVFAYPFYGYWRDVGTIQAYWEANMELIKKDGGISPQQWKIMSNVEAEERTTDRAPARYGTSANVQCSMISAGCDIQGTVVNSVLSLQPRVPPTPTQSSSGSSDGENRTVRRWFFRENETTAESGANLDDSGMLTAPRPGAFTCSSTHGGRRCQRLSRPP